MWTEEIESILQELNIILHQPWDDHAERNIVLFEELATHQGGVTTLVSSPQSIASHHAILAISFLLTEVELYRNEIKALYVWLAAVSDRLDENSRGNLATAIQRHIAILRIHLPLEHSIKHVMIPFLLENLTINDWPTRNSAVSSLDMLDGISRLGKWFTKAQLTELWRNLREFQRLNEVQDLASLLSFGRLKRFVKQ